MTHLPPQASHPLQPFENDFPYKLCTETCVFFLAWPPLQSLAVKKKTFFVQILGGEKLLKFGEKWAVKNL